MRALKRAGDPAIRSARAEDFEQRLAAIEGRIYQTQQPQLAGSRSTIRSCSTTSSLRLRAWSRAARRRRRSRTMQCSPTSRSASMLNFRSLDRLLGTELPAFNAKLAAAHLPAIERRPEPRSSPAPRPQATRGGRREGVAIGSAFASGSGMNKASRPRYRRRRLHRQPCCPRAASDAGWQVAVIDDLSNGSRRSRVPRRCPFYQGLDRGTRARRQAHYRRARNPARSCISQGRSSFLNRSRTRLNIMRNNTLATPRLIGAARRGWRQAHPLLLDGRGLRGAGASADRRG